MRKDLPTRFRAPSLHEPAERAAGRRHLRRDPVLAPIVKRWGDVWPGRPASPFTNLVVIIVDQQISTMAAASIRRRLWKVIGRRPRADSILAASDDELRAAGLSRQKARYLRSLAEHVASKQLVLRKLPWRSDDEVIEVLTQVTGLGRWSAEMYLLFVLGRRDVMSVADLGLQNAARNLYELEERPDRDAFLELAERWRPYRGLASAYLWASLDLGNWTSR